MKPVSNELYNLCRLLAPVCPYHQMWDDIDLAYFCHMCHLGVDP